MAIQPLKAQIAKIVCENFVHKGGGTPRHPLIVAVRDSTLLDDMTTQTLLREEDHQTRYFPTLGTFALLSDDDPKFLAARAATTLVLHIFRNIYESGSPHINLVPMQLLDSGRELYSDIDQSDFDFGLYLVDFPGLSAVQGYSRTADHIGLRLLSISERIMMVEDPESDWKRCVENCRQKAQQPESRTLLTGATPVPRAETPAAPKQKSWVPENWILGKSIGEGGQGWTYRVRRNGDEEGGWFALKRLKNADRADRFHSEIRALRTLNHAGILRIEESGTTEGKPYYIAEYCASGDLSARNFNGRTTLEKLQLFRQICAALAAAHSKKIVHRDIKPSNILVRADGTVAVGDFGLCLHLDEGERITTTEEAIGARNYMAPELADGRSDVTSAADVYSLGKLLYFIFAGRSFSREDHRESKYDLTHPPEGQPEQGIQFVYEIFDKSIVRRPESRFQDAGALADAVDGIVRKIVLNAHVLDMGVTQRCLYCVNGEYIRYQGQADANRMLLVCRECGNTQSFSPPFNGWGAWWMKR
jgi:hypothetical protein